MSKKDLKDKIDLNEIRILSEISKLISDDNNNTIHPVWDEIDDKLTLHLFTYNDRNGQSFLLKSLPGNVKVGILSKMLNYLTDEMPSENKYSVTWIRKEGKEEQLSYFHGNSIVDIINKFYFGKEVEDISILEIKLLKNDE